MQPLRGIVVVAVEQAVAAPICTRHLGDLGARVIKVENRPGIGSGQRELVMFRSSPRRPLFSWLLRRLGPPPPPPRGHFSKSWNYDAQHRAPSGREGAGRHRVGLPKHPARPHHARSGASPRGA